MKPAGAVASSHTWREQNMRFCPITSMPGDPGEGITLFYTEVSKTAKLLTSMAKLLLPAMVLVPGQHVWVLWGTANPQAPRAPSGLWPTINSDQHREGTSSPLSFAELHTVDVPALDLHSRNKTWLSSVSKTYSIIWGNLLILHLCRNGLFFHSSHWKQKLNSRFIHTWHLNSLFQHRNNTIWEFRWNNAEYCKNEKITMGSFKPNAKLY